MPTRPLTALQVAAMLNAMEKARMIEGDARPEQRMFLERNGSVDWQTYDRAWEQYKAKTQY